MTNFVKAVNKVTVVRIWKKNFPNPVTLN